MNSTPRSAVKKTLWGSFIGTTLEWYDFFLYGSMAVIVFPTLFFSHASGHVATLLSLSTFGVAFVVRPLGAVIFGNLGDRVGRRRVLVLTMVLMGLSTAAIGLLPTSASIGLAAPALLVVMRILQGFSTGGEWGGALLMAVENAPSERSPSTGAVERRGLFGSIVQAASPAGLLLSNGAILLASQLSDEAFLSWGWRVPFVLGGAIAVVGLFIRLQVPETEVFEKLKQHDQVERMPVLAALRRFPLAVVLTAGTYVGVGTVFYAALIFGQKYGAGLGLSRNQMLSIVVLFAAVLLVLTPVSGALSDRLGHKRNLMVGLVLLVPVTALWLSMFSTGDYGIALAGYLMLAVGFAIAWGPLAVFFARSFAPEVRYSGVSLGYQFGTVLGGAVPPLVAVELFDRYGRLAAVGAYVLGTVVLSLVCAAAIASVDRQHTRARSGAGRLVDGSAEAVA